MGLEYYLCKWHLKSSQYAIKRVKLHRFFLHNSNNILPNYSAHAAYRTISIVYDL